MAQLTVHQAFDLAVQHHQSGRLHDAQQLYEQILAQMPAHAGAIHFLGIIAHQRGEHERASQLICQAIVLRPKWAEEHRNLSLVLRETGQLEEAAAASRQAVALAADNPDFHCNLGDVLLRQGKLEEAIQAYREALALRPAYAEAQNNLGIALREIGQLDAAIDAFQAAISANRNYAHANLGNALRVKGQFDEAIAAHRQAIAAAPNLAEAQSNLGNVLSDIGELDEAIAAYRRAISLNPNFAAAHSNLILSLHYHPDFDSRMIGDELRVWGRQHADSLPRLDDSFSSVPVPERRLRIGYLSPDFREHVVGWNLLPVLRHHDRDQLEITCYAQVPSPDATTAQLKQHSDRWRSIVGLSDEQAARQIRDDQIDVLIDLSLHTAQNRLLVFARRPAPVQVTWLGYCGSSGMAAMDYRLSDPYLDPPETDLSCYTEQTLRLPRTYWCFEPRPAPPVAPPPVLKNGFVTFGCLNNFAKVSSAALDLWARILAAAPASRIILHSPQGSHRQRVLRQMANAGILQNRVHFAAKEPWESYVQHYAQIDIGLDPFPYGGGITTIDALWMGVPTITLSGRTAVGRGGRSILSNIGLAELIAFSHEQYEELATELARDIQRMTKLRFGMRSRMLASPLADVRQYTRDVEMAYREMWNSYAAQSAASPSAR
jgi:predicted O-linked N-acetylglucosamine transferase (SPINDLY family)